MEEFIKNIQFQNKEETENNFTEEEILNSNDVDLIAKYAKEKRSKVAIDKTRELLEIARRNGEEVVQNFLKSFKECEVGKKEYLDFENTKSGRLALDFLNKMPEPFKTNAYKKFEDYKKELIHNTELFKKHNNNPEKIWEEIFGFGYYNVPDFKERLKDFLFRDVKAVAQSYYKKNNLEVKQDPFAINFFIEDVENFNRILGNSKNLSAGFSTKKNGVSVNVMRVDKEIKNELPSLGSREEIHEKEHSIHRATKTFNSILFDDESLNIDSDFSWNMYLLKKNVKWDYEERLKKAEDEIFAYLKNKEDKESVEYYLNDKSDEAVYDYAKTIRSKNNEIINNNKILSEKEKQKLRDGINFIQTGYDRVLKNMIDVVYSKNESVEYLRNLPINEWHKASNGKYNRTDFIIKDFKL